MRLSHERVAGLGRGYVRWIALEKRKKLGGADFRFSFVGFAWAGLTVLFSLFPNSAILKWLFLDADKTGHTGDVGMQFVAPNTAYGVA